MPLALPALFVERLSSLASLASGSVALSVGDSAIGPARLRSRCFPCCSCFACFACFGVPRSRAPGRVAVEALANSLNGCLRIYQKLPGCVTGSLCRPHLSRFLLCFSSVLCR